MFESTQASRLDTSSWPSVNALANPLVADLVANAKELRLGVAKLQVADNLRHSRPKRRQRLAHIASKPPLTRYAPTSSHKCMCNMAVVRVPHLDDGWRAHVHVQRCANCDFRFRTLYIKSNNC